MTRQIVIVDETAAQRIVIAAAIARSGLRATSCATLSEALPRIEAGARILIVSLCVLRSARMQRLRARLGPQLAVMAVLPEDRAGARLSALRDGADTLLLAPIHAGLLRADLRKMQRMLRVEHDLLPNPDRARALGFAEPGADSAKRQVLLFSGASDLHQSIAGLTRAQVAQAGLQDRLRRDALTPDASAADVIVFDHRGQGANSEALLRTMADLRADDSTCLIMQIVLFDASNAEMAATALDMGADDVVAGDFSAAEVAHRTGRLILRKQARDQFRARVRDGLRAALTDPLTGLANRRFAMSKLVQLSQETRPFALCAIDLDHFKRVNDQHGHAAGDEVLAAIAARLRDASKARDLVARIGGEEFLIATPVDDLDQAQTVAGQIAQHIRARPVHLRSGARVSVTASIGLAYRNQAVDSERDAEALIQHADRALYAAKHAGRDRVRLAQNAA